MMPWCQLLFALLFSTTAGHTGVIDDVNVFAAVVRGETPPPRTGELYRLAAYAVNVADREIVFNDALRVESPFLIPTTISVISPYATGVDPTSLTDRVQQQRQNWITFDNVFSVQRGGRSLYDYRARLLPTAYFSTADFSFLKGNDGDVNPFDDDIVWSTDLYSQRYSTTVARPYKNYTAYTAYLPSSNARWNNNYTHLATTSLNPQTTTPQTTASNTQSATSSSSALPPLSPNNHVDSLDDCTGFCGKLKRFFGLFTGKH